MQNHLQESQASLATHFYQILLLLYPREFRNRFGAEMHGVFVEALAENREQSFWNVFQFLWHEFTEAPASIFDQHQAARSPWLQPYHLNLSAFTLGFILIGVYDSINTFNWLNFIHFDQSFFFLLITYLLTGGLGGLAIGCALGPTHKKFFVLSGSIGFLLANLFSLQIFKLYFPDAMTSTQTGWATYLPLLFPLMTGVIYGFFIAIPTVKWRIALRCVWMSMLAFLAGYFVNRLSAALMQSYLFPGSLLGKAHQANYLIYIFVPDILEGLLLGVIFGGLAQHNRLTPAFH
jgi:hypothetical protein